jgi:hypothetical protein
MIVDKFFSLTRASNCTPKGLVMNKGYILLLAPRPAGIVARSLHAQRHGWAFGPSSRRSRLASEPGGLQRYAQIKFD